MIFRTLKNKIYKCMTSVSKNMYINHSTIKMKPADVKLSKYIEFKKTWKRILNL